MPEGEKETPVGSLRPEVMEPVTVLDAVLIITILPGTVPPQAVLQFVT